VTVARIACISVVSAALQTLILRLAVLAVLHTALLASADFIIVKIVTLTQVCQISVVAVYTRSACCVRSALRAQARTLHATYLVVRR